jgi:hypothetical protein
MAARTLLRTRVFQPAGSERSCPKQWHSGFRPRAKFALIPTTKSSSSTSAPTAPHQAVEVGIRAAATASSASGSKTPSRAAKDAGTPKSTNARFDPARSASLVTPATLKTATSSTRATSSATSMKCPLAGRLAEPRQLGALLPYIPHLYRTALSHVPFHAKQEGGTGVDTDPTSCNHPYLLGRSFVAPPLPFDSPATRKLHAHIVGRCRS